VLELSDILRAALVFSVSAFDTYIHDMVIEAMREMFEELRPRTESFRHQRRNAADSFSVSRGQLSCEQFAFYVERRNRLISFQSVKNISNAIRSIKPIEIWDEVAQKRGILSPALRDSFEVIIQRRNTIVHQADLMPVLAGFRNPIDEQQFDRSHQFLVALAADIDSLLNE
jgi:hypothetical protein